jgi:signal transduction histidine kinase
MVNAAKHSGADEVALMCEVGPSTVTVFVRDRGAGFDPAAIGSSGGVGRSIVERMRRHGGDAAVRSTPGTGTEVEITAPIGIDDE